MAKKNTKTENLATKEIATDKKTINKVKTDVPNKSVASKKDVGKTSSVSKAAAKPVAKKEVAKPAPKATAKPVAKKEVAKPAPKAAAKPVAKVEESKPIAKKAAPKSKKSIVSIPSKAKQAEIVEMTEAEKKAESKKKAKRNLGFDELAGETTLTYVREKPEEIGAFAPAVTVRYSDEDLAMFESVVNQSKAEAMDEMRMLKERLDDLTSFDMAEESMIYSMHMAEQGSEAQEKEKTYSQIQRIHEYIKKLDEALDRIRNKSYGICRVCNCLIAKERLLAVPVTTLSASYKIHQRCPEDGFDKIEPVKNQA
jgi:RNA polymerase-binding transcription factor DksA